MNRSIILCGTLLFPAALWAQDSLNTDTSRTIMLQEVIVSSKANSRQHDLFNYYKVNKAATTEDIMARLPELSLVRRGSYGMEPVIRGFNSNQVNLLLNGMKIHGACTDKMDPASIYIEPVNLNSIELQTSGRSTISGSSVGGSINLKLAEAAFHDEPRISGTVNSGYHSVSSSFFNSAELSFSGRKFGIRFSGTYRKAANYQDGSGKVVNFSRYEKINYALNAKYRVSERSFLKIDLLADDGWNIGYPSLPMDVGYANARIAAISLNRSDPASKWETVEARLYANRVKHYMDDTHRPSVQVHMDMPGESITYGFYAEGSRKAGRSKLVVRADASTAFLKASMTMYQPGQPPMFMLTWPDNRQLQSGLAAQMTIPGNSKTIFRFNGRADFISYSLMNQAGKDQMAVFGFPGQDMNYFIPSLSALVNYQLTGKLRTSFSLGLNGRAPTAPELYGFYLFSQFDGYDYIGNPSLEKETGLQTEWTVSYISGKWRVHTAAYLNRISNHITSSVKPGFSAMTNGAKGVKQYFNLDHSLVRGAEVSIVAIPWKYIQFVTAMKHVRGQDKNGEALALMPPLKNTSSAKLSLGRFWLQGEAEFASRQNLVDSRAGEFPTGSYSLFHIRAGCNLEIGRSILQLNTGVENIFDVYYREHLDWGNIGRPGRNIYLQAGISF